ncbi:TPA: hypothetical protein ACH3X2_001406 [Trebouxia sp. C0005]
MMQMSPVCSKTSSTLPSRMQHAGSALPSRCSTSFFQGSAALPRSRVFRAVKTSQRRGASVVVVKAAQRTVVIGLAADSGM